MLPPASISLLCNNKRSSNEGLWLLKPDNTTGGPPLPANTHQYLHRLNTWMPDQAGTVGRSVTAVTWEWADSQLGYRTLWTWTLSFRPVPLTGPCISCG